MLFSTVFMPVEWWNHYYLNALLWAMIMPQAFTVIFWIIGIFAIMFNRYRVPIAIDEDLVLQEDYDDKLVKEVLSEVGKDENALKNKVETKTEKPKTEKKDKDKKPPKPKTVKVVCKNCGCTVKVEVDEKTCPNCEENIYGED